MGLSAWKLVMIAAVVGLVFLPRLIRIGRFAKDSVDRFTAERDQEDRVDPVMAGGPVIDGRTGRLIPPTPPAAPRQGLAERGGLALGRLAGKLKRKLSDQA